MIIRSTRVLLPDGIRPAEIEIADARIAAVRPLAPSSALGLPSSVVVMPGIVDTHVHVNEPGRTEWEGFATATAAAAAGGITTIVDMPLNSVPATTTIAGLEAKRRAGPRRRHRDRVLGRRRAGQRDGSRGTRGRRRARLQVLHVAVRRGRSSGPSSTAICGARCASSRRSACRCSSTPSGRRRCA
jgi:hypothetical protein